MRLLSYTNYCIAAGVTVFSNVFESQSMTRSGPDNSLTIKLSHRILNSFVTLKRNIKDIKEFSVVGQADAIILSVQSDDGSDVRIKFSVLPSKGLEYVWELEPMRKVRYVITFNIFCCNLL